MSDKVQNTLTNVSIAGKATFGDETNNIILDAAGIKYVYDMKALEAFSALGLNFIASVANEITIQAKTGDGDSHDFGLDENELKKKFENMKCSDSYRHDFNKKASYFPTVNQILSSDGAIGGADAVIQAISIITKMYFLLVGKYDNGDLIHSMLLGEFVKNNANCANSILATDILICFSINECGIFNEKK